MNSIARIVFQKTHLVFDFIFFSFFAANVSFAAELSTKITSSPSVLIEEDKEPSFQNVDHPRLARKKPSEATLLKNDKRILYTSSPISRLRAAPDDKSKIVAKLRINTALRGVLHLKQKHVVMQNEKWIKVQAYPPKGRVQGFILADDVVKKPLDAAELLQEVKGLLNPKEPNQKSTRRLLRRAKKRLQQACAVNPSSLDAIEAYASFLEMHGGKTTGTKAETTLYYIRKGWLAARRRALHWDGPLYPIVDGYAYMSGTCDERAKANGKRKHIPNLELRARTFPFFSSGKSVALSEKGYETQKLKKPSCRKDQLVYRMSGAKNGTLLSSWRVAGFRVLPFVVDKKEMSSDNIRSYKAGRIRISLHPSGFILAEDGVNGVRTSREHAFPDEISVLSSSALPVPVAWFSEAERQEIVVLFSYDGLSHDSLSHDGVSHDGRATCSSGVSLKQWLVRLLPDDDKSEDDKP
ncbi:MAG: hypothetical protein GY822_18485, partial [Deltaproteobacteria bacterium]|nr:hypothetical protein [Deltaproteobacteria bacterium]